MDFLALMAISACLASCGGGSNPPVEAPVDPNPPSSWAFIQRQGGGLVEGENPYRIRGITFSSNYYGATGESITNPALNHDHSAADYAKVADLGMNVVQLILSYKAFEDDNVPFTYKAEGWNWLDDNIAQAKKNGLRVVLDLLTVAGGAWHDQSSSADFRFWTDSQFRQRYIAFWKAIATRYANEPVVAAYSLLNEPVTADTDGSSWWGLADDTITAIRTVDTKHLIILNPLAGVNGKYYVPSGVPNRILVSDPNILYDIHLYVPPGYASQGAPWDPSTPAGGGVYPDESVLEVIGNLEYAGENFENPGLPADSSDWQELAGEAHTVVDSNVVIAHPAVQCRSMTMTGTAYFDDFVVNEYDENGVLIGIVAQGTVTQTSVQSGPWCPWSSDGNGAFAISAEGYGDAQALNISGNSTLAIWTNPSAQFLVTAGHSYQVKGWAKGMNIDANSQCRFGLYFYKPDSECIAGRRNRSLLQNIVEKRLVFEGQRNAPMIFSEFGLMRLCYDDTHGGMTWLADMVDAFDQHGANYIFFTYHNTYMGIYGDENQLPNSSTEIPAILDFFKNALK